MSLWEECLRAYWCFLLVRIIGSSCSFSPFTVRRFALKPISTHTFTLTHTWYTPPHQQYLISGPAAKDCLPGLSIVCAYAWKLQCQYHPHFCNELHIISQAPLDSRHSIHGNPLKFHMFSFLVFASARQAGTLADHMHLSAHDYPAISSI